MCYLGCTMMVVCVICSAGIQIIALHNTPPHKSQAIDWQLSYYCMIVMRAFSRRPIQDSALCLLDLIARRVEFLQTKGWT